MPIFEYDCPNCRTGFELMRPRSEFNLMASCPQCNSNSKRIISAYSHYSASAPDSQEIKSDKFKDKQWQATRKLEDGRIKNPDPLKSWREERCKTLGYGPEKWVEWAEGEKKKEQKKNDYGGAWLGREL